MNSLDCKAMLDRDEIEKRIEQLSPFLHEIELPYGLWTRSPEARRVNDAPPRVWELLELTFPELLGACGGSLEGLDVLEAACNSGGMSVEASRHGAQRVLATDAVDQYVEQASLVKEALDLDNVEVRKLNVYDVDSADIGYFDVTLCYGLLYHLESPVLAMRKLAEVTRRVMIVDTTTLPMPKEDRRALWRMNFAPKAPDDDNERAETNLWRDRDYVQFEPTVTAVRRLLRFAGFDEVRRIKPSVKGLSKSYYDGRRTAFIAIKNPPEESTA